MKNKKPVDIGQPEMEKEKSSPKEGFLERGNKGHDSQNMGNDISGEIKIANSKGEMEGGEDKTWHLKEGD